MAVTLTYTYWCHHIYHLYHLSDSIFLLISAKKSATSIWWISPEKQFTFSRSFQRFIILQLWENVMIVDLNLDDFNVAEKSLKFFCKNYSFRSLIKPPTFNKNQNNPTSIDLIFANESRNFHSARGIRNRAVQFLSKGLDCYGKRFQTYQKRSLILCHMKFLWMKVIRKTRYTNKWSFPLRIFLVTVTKSAVSCGFGHIYWRNL